MTSYKHRQPATLMLRIMSVVGLVMIGAALTIAKAAWVGVPIIALTGWLFHSLTIEIAADTLRWHFGPGLIHKQVPLDQIVSARPVRTNALEGWGIHWSRFGWLYNVSGFDAVAIELRNGKRFALGTDEPQALAAALHSIAVANSAQRQ
jgi:hypothetical protein